MKTGTWETIARILPFGTITFGVDSHGVAWWLDGETPIHRGHWRALGASELMLYRAALLQLVAKRHGAAGERAWARHCIAACHSLAA